MKQNGMPKMVVCHKLQISKIHMEDGPHFEIITAQFAVEKLSAFEEIWFTEANSNKNDSLQQNKKFSKFKTPVIRHFQDSILAITQHRIILFWSNFV